MGNAFVKGSETSRQAAEDIEPTAGTLRHEVLLTIRSGDGLTDEQIQDITGMAPNTQRPRRRELVSMGLVMDSGRRRATHSGRQAVMWVDGDGRPAHVGGTPSERVRCGACDGKGYTTVTTTDRQMGLW